MAFCWGLIVALFALNVGFSSAADNATTTSAPATSAAAGNGSIKTTAGVTTLSPPGGFYTYLITRFKGDPCPEGKEAAEKKEASLTSTFNSFFADPKFDFKPMTFVTRATCEYNFTLTFGPNLQMYNVSEVFEDELKKIDYTVDCMKLTDIKTDVYVEYAMPGEFKVGTDECEKKCCGTGGPITLTRTCKPKVRCRSYKLKKVEQDCMDVCSKECSGVIMCKISLIVLLFGVFMNWFLK